MGHRPDPTSAPVDAIGEVDASLDLQILVMGMHRGGTSAVAGLLHAAGISAGDAAELMPVRPENPLFFGERLSVMGFNDRLLGALGWTWDAPAATPDTSPPAHDELIAEGRVLVDAIRVGGARSIKDPRISVLLPWWRRMLFDRFIAVVPVRAPEEVAWSLSVRDGMPFELGLALWAAYHRHLAAGLDGLPAIVIDYGALTEEPERVVPVILAEVARLGITTELDAVAAAGSVHQVLRRATQPARMTASSIDDDLARARDPWNLGPVQGFERFAGVVTTPAGWEVAVLDLQRGARQTAGQLLVTQRDLAEVRAEAAASRAASGRAHDAQLAAEESQLAAEAARVAADEARSRDVAQALADAAAARRAADQAAEMTRIAERSYLRERARSDADAAAARVAAAAAMADMDRRLADASAAQARLADELVAQRALAAASFGARVRGYWSGGTRKIIQRVKHATVHGRLARRARTFPSALRRSPLFDAPWYLSRYPDVRDAGADAYRHYRRHGIAEGRDPNPLFSTAWYLAQNPDVGAARMDPLEHYFLYGADEGRDPSPSFDTDRYLDAYPDVRAAGMNPLLHYLRHGQHEGRHPRPSGSGSQAARSEPGPGPTDGAGPGSGSVRGIRPPLLVSAGIGSRPGTRTHSGKRMRQALRAPGIVTWLQELTPAPIPVGSHVLVMSGGDDRWLRIPGARATHLPRDREGGYPAVEPVSDTAVIAQLEWQRSGGAEFLVVPDQASPQLERLPNLARHIESRFEPVASVPGRGTVRDLRTVIPGPPGEAAAGDLLEHGRRPTVSIVIPNFGSIDLLRACLRSLGETLPTTFGVEIIVVDDASPTDSRPMLERLIATMPTGQLIVNDTNRGFLASANRGGAAATGDLLVLLNNDTVTLPGWLDAIVGTFREHPEAGVVGGRLVYPDGRLQEAGGLVFVDGTAAKLGYGDADPDAPMYVFLRDTDYVSGALLATPRELFESLDGLDPAYGFGFYEDTDYCFRVRQTGRRVLYQPESVVIHVEGGTAGVDTSVGPKRSQVENQVRFAARWAESLGDRPARPVTARPEDWYAAAIRERHDLRVAP